jgi:hypothetical protein
MPLETLTPMFRQRDWKEEFSCHVLKRILALLPVIIEDLSTPYSKPVFMSVQRGE